MAYNRTRGERTTTHLGWSPLTSKVYLIKGNGQREDWTQHFMGFCDQNLPLPRAAKEAIADALGLTLPPEVQVPPCTYTDHEWGPKCAVHGLDKGACSQRRVQDERDARFVWAASGLEDSPASASSREGGAHGRPKSAHAATDGPTPGNQDMTKEQAGCHKQTSTQTGRQEEVNSP